MKLKFHIIKKNTIVFIITVADELPPVPEHNPCVPNPCGPFTECTPQNGRPKCACMADYLGTVEAGCEPGCVANSDCPPHEACVNRLCVDPCKGACSPGAECRVVRHHPKCVCPEGFTGDYLTGCTPLPGK